MGPSEAVGEPPEAPLVAVQVGQTGAGEDHPLQPCRERPTREKGGGGSRGLMGQSVFKRLPIPPAGPSLQIFNQSPRIPFEHLVLFFPFLLQPAWANRPALQLFLIRTPACFTGQMADLIRYRLVAGVQFGPLWFICFPD